ncbi:hypothetical protein SEA_MARSHAWN_73 [Mycobacterium phage Marshawn]|uniref:Uncharacterized protein n=1 Tax=Mycobacterium phage Marshawn TaxID=2652423 RepID=A0A5P8D931_9CAUD|nr:hypothetical protein I5H02_gp26 [Mycobacterium phage Marshawn]QFP94859.1 hypothetical protein SEA_MARSHAWN_73 [Mycobacterium phage Marshawn]
MFVDTWYSPQGTPVTAKIRNGCDELQLAELYAAETQPDSARFNALHNGADASTLYCWNYGYRNPRVPGRIAECEAVA